MKPLTYITTPYTLVVAPGCGSPTPETDKRIKQMRFEEVTKASEWLMRTYGWNVFSPITHSHPLHAIAGMRGDWEFWKKVDTEYLECSCRLVNFVVPGWRHSTGVKAENKIAEELGIPIFYLHIIGPGQYVLSEKSHMESEPNLFDYDGEYDGCTR